MESGFHEIILKQVNGETTSVNGCLTMSEGPETLSLLLIDDLFIGYTVIHCLDTDQTSVYCERCEEFVLVDVDVLDVTESDFYERVIDSHKSETVRFK